MQTVEQFITSKKWEFSWDRRMSYQKIRHFSFALLGEMSDFFKVPLSPNLYRVKNRIASGYVNAEENKNAFAFIEKQLLDKESVSLLREMITSIRKLEDTFEPYVAKMPLDYALYDNKTLFQAYETYCDLEDRMSFPAWLLFATFEEVITKSLKNALKRELGSEDEVNKVLGKISSPSKIIPLDLYNKTLYEILLFPKDQREKMIKEGSRRFISWGMYDVIYPVATEESFIEKLHEKEKLDYGSLLKELNEKYIHQAEQNKRVLDSFEKDTYLHTFLELYITYANYKDWKNFYREQSSYKFAILLAEISKRIDCSLEQIAFMTVEETRDALSDLSIPEKTELDNRMNDSAFMYIDTKITIVTDKKVLQTLDNILLVQNQTELKGTGAYPGKVTGRVCIVMGSVDFPKLKSGDILVTGTTRPDYVPIMQKSAGFVTNEGGLLSHAAIVARELKKPCIIGTKIATKVLKDGDVVEVDAEKGIVKIINK